MNNTQNIQNEANEMLEKTSRTFFIPINQLPSELKDAVTSAYLCMRAIDEIEDHPELSIKIKIDLLQSISKLLQTSFTASDFEQLFSNYTSILPEVSLRLSDWALYSPRAIAPTIWKSTAVMADGMADWVEKKWDILTESDLDQYTYYVAGLVGELLSDIWMWYDNVETNKDLAVSFGRGLQAVNMIRNRAEDLIRGVDFFPNGWDFAEMIQYARRNLVKAFHYSEGIKPGPIKNFCNIPLTLAQATLDAIESGHEKLSRADVLRLVQQATAE